VAALAALISAVGLALVARWVDGVGFSATGWEAVLTVLSASAVLGLLNLLLKPILLIVTLPVNIMTLGLFTLVVNGLVLWAAAPSQARRVAGTGTIGANALALFPNISGNQRRMSPLVFAAIAAHHPAIGGI
jgi:putative membrane protein